MRTPKIYQADTQENNFWRTLDVGYDAAYTYQGANTLMYLGGWSSMNVLNATWNIPPFGYRVGITNIGRDGYGALVMTAPLMHHGFFQFMDDGWAGSGGTTLEATQRTRPQNKYEMVTANYDLVEWYGPHGNVRRAWYSVWQINLPEASGFGSIGWGYEMYQNGSHDTSYLWGQIMRAFYKPGEGPLASDAAALYHCDMTKGTAGVYNGYVSGGDGEWPGQQHYSGSFGGFKMTRNSSTYNHSMYREPTGYLTDFESYGQGIAYSGS